MAKYRKKPIVIEAFQFNDDFVDGKAYIPEWITEAFEKDIIKYDNECPTELLWINTLKGIVIVSLYDYIIKDINGKIFSCEPYIFEKMYERI